MLHRGEVPLALAGCKLVNILAQVLDAELVKRTDVCPFQQCPEGFHSNDVHHIVDLPTDAVFYYVMLILLQSRVSLMPVGVDSRLWFNSQFNDRE